MWAKAFIVVSIWKRTDEGGQAGLELASLNYFSGGVQGPGVIRKGKQQRVAAKGEVGKGVWGPGLVSLPMKAMLGAPQIVGYLQDSANPEKGQSPSRL